MMAGFKCPNCGNPLMFRDNEPLDLKTKKEWLSVTGECKQNCGIEQVVIIYNKEKIQ